MKTPIDFIWPQDRVHSKHDALIADLITMLSWAAFLGYLALGMIA